jgi:hypothetical protein
MDDMDDLDVATRLRARPCDPGGIRSPPWLVARHLVALLFMHDDVRAAVRRRDCP